jgi:hypothetical protein
MVVNMNSITLKSGLLLLLIISSFINAQAVKVKEHSEGWKPFVADDVLPPLIGFKGESESYIQPASNPWQTFSEKSGLTATPNYQQTMQYTKRLLKSDNRLQLVTLGTSPQGRDIVMLVASKDGAKDAVSLTKNNKPTLLIQAGIHSGEIDGKDAGLMLLRDIVHGGKGHYLDSVNILFVPILNVDGHERISEFNRVNQRGPGNMGWRTNSLNLNLNRDYSKLETIELRAVIEAINQWQPSLYYDVHVTDGEDYQYDITYGYNVPYGESPNIAAWLDSYLKPTVNKALKDKGHLGGPLTFGIDSKEFSKGIVGWSASPRFSNGYGDYRNLPTVLVENHSLKPYKQRVLGTYVLLESTLQILTQHGKGLIEATNKDKSRRPSEIVVAWDVNFDKPQKMDFYGMDYEKKNDKLTGLDFIAWKGKAKLYEQLPVFVMNKVKQKVAVPQFYWIPEQYHTVIERLKSHGILMTQLEENKTKNVIQLISQDHKLSDNIFESRQMVDSKFISKLKRMEIEEGTYQVATDQELGRLAVALLDPRAPDSFFAWGYFNSMFQRTEYIESYAMIPMAKLLFERQPNLLKEYEKLKETNKAFAADQKQQFEWIYRHSPFYDEQYLKYPVVMSEQ